MRQKRYLLEVRTVLIITFCRQVCCNIGKSGYSFAHDDRGMGGGAVANKDRGIASHIRLKELGKSSHSLLQFPFLASSSSRVYQKDVKGHFGCVNAIEASVDQNFIASGE